MNKKDTKYFRELLTDWLEDLLKRSDDVVFDLVDSTTHAKDPVDQASLETDLDIRLRLSDRESRLINKIRQALERLDDGTYGICDECGEPISIQRLKARPVTTLCINCKSRMEVLEKTLEH